MHIFRGGFIAICLQLAAVFIIGIWVCVPLLMYYFPLIGAKMIFFNNYFCPMYTDLKNFEIFGLSPKYSRNFYEKSLKGNFKLGFWHLLPKIRQNGSPTDQEKENMLSDGNPVILYLHGNALNRGGRHMVDLYRQFIDINCHVVTMDYRGYGDSEGTPWTEDDVVFDAMTAWNYVKKLTKGRSNIYVWGHSLGTGVSSSLLKRLYEKGEVPHGLILESPFTNMRDGTYHHPFSNFYRGLPYFYEVFVRNPEKNGVYLNTVDNVLFVDCPILILHSKDDHVLPYHFAEKIEKELKEHRKDVELKLFPEGNQYYHVDLWKDPEFKSTVGNFIRRTSSTTKLH